MAGALTLGQGWEHEQEMLYRLALGLAESSRVRGVADQLFVRARNFLRTDYEFLMLANAGGSALKGLAARGVHADSLRQEHIQTAQELPPVVLAFRTKQPVVIADFARDPLIGARLQRKYHGMRRTWMLPLVHRERVIGVLGVGYATQQEISPQQFRVLQRLKDEATRALAPALLTGVLLESYERLSPLPGDRPAALPAPQRSHGAREALPVEEGWLQGQTEPQWRTTNVVALRPKGMREQRAPDRLTASGWTGPRPQYRKTEPAELQGWYSHGGAPAGQPLAPLPARDSQQREWRWRDFLSTFAHDIRNPLGVIMGYAEMLIEQAQERGSPEGTDLLERIKNSALMVHALVSNYLDLTRIEAERLTVTKQPLALNEVVRRVGQLYEAEARRRRVTVEWQLHPDLPVVEGDPLALERVFANLLHNALKFTPAAGRVTVSSTRQDGEVIVAVADTGPGIAPEELPALFEKYRRAAPSLAQEGTGLGLFIVKSLVEAHGGRVTVHSVPGQGACFRVILSVSDRPLPAT